MPTRWTDTTSIIKRLVRWLGDSSLKIYARLNDEEWTQYTPMGYSTVVNSHIAARLAQEGPLDWHNFLQAQLAGDPEPAEGPTDGPTLPPG